MISSGWYVKIFFLKIIGNLTKWSKGLYFKCSPLCEIPNPNSLFPSTKTFYDTQLSNPKMFPLVKVKMFFFLVNILNVEHFMSYFNSVDTEKNYLTVVNISDVNPNLTYVITLIFTCDSIMIRQCAKIKCRGILCQRQLLSEG